jgi:hypothetical protein
MLSLSKLNWPRILFSRRAAVLLGFAAILSIVAIAIIHSDVNPDSLSPLQRGAVSFAGTAGALGYFALLICMGLFWLKCDSSSRRSKAVWLVLLLVGWGYGSQIAYFVLIYLPAVFKGLRSMKVIGPLIEHVHVDPRRKLFGPFGWVLVGGWGLLFLTVAACFTFPKDTSYILEPVGDFFVLWPVSLLIGTWVYAIILIFRVGMRFSTRSSPSDSLRQR